MSAATLEPLAYGVKDSARLLGVCESTIKKLIREGDLSAARIGDRVLIPRAELARLLEVKV